MRKSLASKAHKIADAAISAFERVAADLHLAADLLDDEAEKAYELSDALRREAGAKEALGSIHSDAAADHRKRAERIAALVG